MKLRPHSCAVTRARHRVPWDLLQFTAIAMPRASPDGRGVEHRSA